jgi:hypothetical protein
MTRCLPLLFLLACTPEPTDTDEPQESVSDLDTVTSSARPTKRSEIYGIADESSNTILVFGGNDGPIVSQMPKAAYTDDTWIFEPGYGWTQLDIEGPSPRARYGATYDPTNRRALIFGGRWRIENGSGDYTLYNDLWQFDFVTRTWTLLDDGNGPSKRTYSSLAWDDTTETLYLFGGMTNTSPMTIDVNMKVWRWDGAEWERSSTSGDKPSQRTFLSEAWDSKRQKLVIFGGQVGDYWSYAYNETYALDVNTMEWAQLNAGDGPSTRMHGHLTYDTARDRYLMFGGHTDIGDGNDLWAMNPETGSWSVDRGADEFTGVGLGCAGVSSEVPADYVDQDTSAPERRHRGMFTLMHDSLWIFGGMHAECSDHLDDTWRYPLSGGDWTELLEARAGESCERRDDDCECLCW